MNSRTGGSGYDGMSRNVGLDDFWEEVHIIIIWNTKKLTNPSAFRYSSTLEIEKAFFFLVL